MVQGFKNKLLNAGNKLTDALLGQKVPDTDAIEMNELLKGVDTSSPYFAENMGEEEPLVNITTSSNPRIGGLIPDLASGFKDNYVTGFAAPNLTQNQTPDGRNKGFAYRLGEGLGTVGRIIDSPLGRGLLAAGLNSALGYNNSLQEGLTAAVGRQQAKTANDLYRQQLEAQGIDTSNIGGNMTSDMYRQLLYGQQLKENADYRNLYLANQQRQNEIMNQIRQDQLKRQERQDEIRNNFDRERLSQGWSRIQDAREARASKNNDNKKLQEGMASLNAMEQQLKNYESMFKNMPGKLETYTIGKLREATGTQTKDQAEFESRTNLLFNKIARDLGGEKGVLSDQDIARVKEAMPKYTDSYEQKMAKMRAIYDLLEIAKSKYSYKLNVNAEPISMGYDDEGWAF